jgi:hypothetical protein
MDDGIAIRNDAIKCHPCFFLVSDTLHSNNLILLVAESVAI